MSKHFLLSLSSCVPSLKLCHGQGKWSHMLQSSSTAYSGFKLGTTGYKLYYDLTDSDWRWHFFRFDTELISLHKSIKPRGTCKPVNASDILRPFYNISIFNKLVYYGTELVYIFKTSSMDPPSFYNDCHAPHFSIYTKKRKKIVVPLESNSIRRSTWGDRARARAEQQ